MTNVKILFREFEKLVDAKFGNSALETCDFIIPVLTCSVRLAQEFRLATLFAKLRISC